MKYKIDDKPGMLPLLLYGLQWWLVSIPCVVIMGIIIARMHYGDLADQTFYLQKLFGLMGAAMIVQVLFGHRLPLIIGPASVLLIGVISTISSGVAAIYTAIFVGGAVLLLLAVTGLLSKLQFIFTSRIVTVILILIAFTLSPVILRLIFSGEASVLFNLVFAVLLVFALVISNILLKGVWKSTTVLWGIGLGSLVYFVANGFPGISTLNDSSSVPLLVFSLDFNVSTIFAFLFCFIALIINELGSIQAVGQMLKADNLEERTNRGVGFLGLSNMFAGLLGVVGPVDYSMSPGVIAATGCASRYTLIPAGIGLIICAFFPSVVQLLVEIPGVVMGAILLYLMASQLSAGLQMLVKDNTITNFNHGIIIGLPLMIALMLSFAPADILNQIPPLIRPIIGNGFVMGVLAVLIMEHLLFKKEKK